MSSQNWAPVRFDTILVRYIFKDDLVWWRALVEEVSYTGTGDDVRASGVLLFDAEPRLQAGGGLEGFAGLGAGVGRDGLAGGQARLAQDQHVLPAAEGVLFQCILHFTTKDITNVTCTSSLVSFVHEKRRCTYARSVVLNALIGAALFCTAFTRRTKYQYGSRHTCIFRSHHPTIHYPQSSR